MGNGLGKTPSKLVFRPAVGSYPNDINDRPSRWVEMCQSRKVNAAYGYNAVTRINITDC